MTPNVGVHTVFGWQSDSSLKPFIMESTSSVCPFRFPHLDLYEQWRTRKKRSLFSLWTEWNGSNSGSSRERARQRDQECISYTNYTPNINKRLGNCKLGQDHRITLIVSDQYLLHFIVHPRRHPFLI